MGTAALLNGRLHVIGGETESGSGATSARVYNRNDIYDPATNTWSLGPPLVWARHGIYPVEYAGELFVLAGGYKAARSKSGLTEIMHPA